MEAVALCVLNRTIKTDKEFPSTIRGVIYENIGSSTTAQYSVVRDGALLKRLNGNFENRTLAYQAAREAMTIFNNYVKNGKARTLKGFKQKDFKYMYFMMNSAFKKQPLNFSKVKYGSLQRSYVFCRLGIRNSSLSGLRQGIFSYFITGGHI